MALKPPQPRGPPLLALLAAALLCTSVTARPAGRALLEDAVVGAAPAPEAAAAAAPAPTPSGVPVDREVKGVANAPAAAPAPGPGAAPGESVNVGTGATLLEASPINWGSPILVQTFTGLTALPPLFSAAVDCAGGGNGEAQCYTARPENLRVENGRLVLEAVRGNYQGSLAGCTNNADNSCTWTQPFTSARIRTKDSPVGSWKYGKVEVRAQLPKGKFLWPAIWMLPKDKVYGEWAASGEIDIMEARGQLKMADIVEGTLHYGATSPYNVWKGSGRKSFPGVDFSTGMHDFAIEWTADAAGRPKLMRWLVDGQPYHEQPLDTMWNSPTTPSPPYKAPGQPWDERFYLIINLAVGGGFFPPQEFGPFGTAAEYDAAVTTWSRPRLEIEHVKVWAQPPAAA